MEGRKAKSGKKTDFWISAGKFGSISCFQVGPNPGRHNVCARFCQVEQILAYVSVLKFHLAVFCYCMAYIFLNFVTLHYILNTYFLGANRNVNLITEFSFKVY